MALPEEIKQPSRIESPLVVVREDSTSLNEERGNLPEGEEWMSTRERLQIAAATIGFLAVSASLESGGNQIASDATFILGLGGVATQNFEMWRRVKYGYMAEDSEGASGYGSLISRLRSLRR